LYIKAAFVIINFSIIINDPTWSANPFWDLSVWGTIAFNITYFREPASGIDDMKLEKVVALHCKTYSLQSFLLGLTILESWDELQLYI